MLDDDDDVTKGHFDNSSFCVGQQKFKMKVSFYHK